jgi:hypothetical protein
MELERLDGDFDYIFWVPYTKSNLVSIVSLNSEDFLFLSLSIFRHVTFDNGL